MFEKVPNAKRIELAKIKTGKVLDHFLYLLDLHENNAIVVYSPTLVSQIPTSHAANAFNVFQRGMHHFEIVRLCALWDRADIEKENIPTVIELIDDDAIVDALAEETRAHWVGRGTYLNPSSDPDIQKIEQEMVRTANAPFGESQALKAKAGLRQATADARALLRSPKLSAVMNLRDKHLAHSLEQTRREKRGPIGPMKYGDETELMEASIPIVEQLHCWVNGASFSIADSRKIDRSNAEALWHGCKFKVLR